jgi:hypothetical protein
MSLKFTAMGRLPLLSTIRTRQRVEDPLKTLTVASGGAGPRGRLLRGVQSRRGVNRLPHSQRIGPRTCAALRPGDLSPLLRPW